MKRKITQIQAPCVQFRHFCSPHMSVHCSLPWSRKGFKRICLVRFGIVLRLILTKVMGCVYCAVGTDLLSIIQVNHGCKKSCHGLGSQLLTSHYLGPGFIPSQCISYLWWAQWLVQGQVFLQVKRFHQCPTPFVYKHYQENWEKPGIPQKSSPVSETGDELIENYFHFILSP